MCVVTDLSGCIICPHHYTAGRTLNLTPRSHRAASGPDSALHTRRHTPRIDPAAREYEPKNHLRQASRAATRSHENGHAAAPSGGCDRHALRPSRPEDELTTECRARQNRHRRWRLTPAKRGRERKKCALRLGMSSAQVCEAVGGGRRRYLPTSGCRNHLRVQRASGGKA